jgi:hypothetical protein
MAVASPLSITVPRIVSRVLIWPRPGVTDAMTAGTRHAHPLERVMVDPVVLTATTSPATPPLGCACTTISVSLANSTAAAVQARADSGH